MVSKDGHHQSLPSPYTHPLLRLKDGVYLPFPWIWAGRSDCLTNLIYYVEFPRLGQKQPCCSLLGWFALGTVLFSNQPLSCERPRPHKEAMWRHWLTAPAELPAYSQCQLLPTLRKPSWMSGLAKPTEDSWLQMHGRPQVRLTQINTINSQNHER